MRPEVERPKLDFIESYKNEIGKYPLVSLRSENLLIRHVGKWVERHPELPVAVDIINYESKIPSYRQLEILGVKKRRLEELFSENYSKRSRSIIEYARKKSKIILEKNLGYDAEFKDRLEEFLQLDDKEMIKAFRGFRGRSKFLASFYKLYCSNLRFVIYIAAKENYFHRGLPPEDVINYGNIGLLKGIIRFKTERGARFLTYAGHWIKYYLRRAVENSRRAMLPVSVLRKISGNVLHNGFKTHTGEGYDCFECVSREEDPAEIAERRDYVVKVHKLMGKVLSKRDKEILIRRVVDGNTLGEISERFNISRERVRQIQNTAIEEIRKNLGLVDSET